MDHQTRASQPGGRDERRLGRLRRGEGRGFGGFEQFISGQGGIVTRGELLDAGWSADELRLVRDMPSRPTRLRRGWYSSREVDETVRNAWAHGGALACWSALDWHARQESAAARDALALHNILDHDFRPDAVHICLPPHAHVRLVEAEQPQTVVRHWHPAALERTARWAVPVEIALEQSQRCAG